MAVNIVSQIDRSVKAGVAAYNWIPPEWAENGTQPKLEDNTAKTDGDAMDKLPKLDEQNKNFCQRTAEAHPGEVTPDVPSGPIRKFKHGFLTEGRNRKWVHPDSDFTHVDPPQFDDEDMDAAGAALGAPQLAKLKKLVGREPLGMQRLAVVFEWALCKTTKLLEGVNIGLGFGMDKKPANRQTYEAARKDYIKFLRDLDDHEPQLRSKQSHNDKDDTKPEPVVPGEPGKSGYGKSLKWIYVCPVISEGRITGAKIAIHWNPHSSSNGIPIPHNP